MIRRPPRSTLSSSSAASDVYKRQVSTQSTGDHERTFMASLSAYQRVKSLGRGSCGTVDLMVQDGKYVALKHIDVESMSDKEKESTMKEVEVMAKIVHPNVVGYFCSFVEDGSLHIGMEYADGGSLQRQWKKAQEAGIHFSEKQILHWCAQICSALKYVHGMKIMHRDLKLANIMLTKQNIVKIADFGLARVLGSQTQFANTCCGTPYYLAPEVCLEKPYDQKSDSWALGCILYELCTLKRPFDAKNLPSIVMKICHGEPKPVSSAYSITLRSLIACLLEKKPHDRPSMDEITRMPFMQDSFAAIAKLVAEARPPQPPDRLKLSKRREGNASSPVPAALSEKFAAAANKVDQAGGNESISKRFSRMREKLGNDASESPRSQEQASQRLNQDQDSPDQEDKSASFKSADSEEQAPSTDASSTAEEWSTRLAESAGLQLGDDADDAGAVAEADVHASSTSVTVYARACCEQRYRTRPHWSLYSISPRPYCSRTTMRTTQR
eukprot:TRINITY_DN5276_c0_g1_i3.p1 TRINITY_DN5276_c0_g1~~TRINITY_DN5276_c0_g1_i3.p1  ORF type:complete len:498 (+),score=103.32 TRINITY_DN5276_c0_g1_i3:110-1603(+)